MRLRTILLCGTVACGLGLALVGVSALTASPVAIDSATRVLARIQWSGTRGDSGTAVFSGVREGTSVNGFLYLAGRQVPVTATLDATGMWAGRVRDTAGRDVGEFAGQLTDGRVRGAYSLDAVAAALPSRVSSSGDWEVRMAAGFEGQ
jgi:hypothetical protein